MGTSQDIADVPAYSSIADYALIGDCHTAALVSAAGSIDWCCLPRFDSESCFGRLLDWERGGYCAIEGASGPSERCYRGDSLVLETTLRGDRGEARLTDGFVHGGILRVLDGRRGDIELRIRIRPRFDYGAVAP